MVVPETYAELSFATSGIVAEVNVREGQEVNQGDVLLRLRDSTQLVLKVAQAEEAKMQAQHALDAMIDDLDKEVADALQELYDAKQEQYDADRDLSFQAESSTSFRKQQAETRVEIADARVELAQRKYDALLNGPDPKKMAEADANFRTAEEQLNAANEALADLEVRAPFRGVVARIDIVPGEQAVAGQTVIVIADFGNWVVETDDLTEIKVVKINLEQPATLIPDSLPDVKLTGRVLSIREIYEEKRGDITYTARISISKMDPQVRWGMTVVVTFQQ
jgi:multidrug resistance efflux pump